MAATTTSTRVEYSFHFTERAYSLIPEGIRQDPFELPQGIDPPARGDLVTLPLAGRPVTFRVLSRKYAFHPKLTTVTLELGHPNEPWIVTQIGAPAA